MSMNASISTCRNGASVIFCSALAIELLPTLPTPLSRMICDGLVTAGSPVSHIVCTETRCPATATRRSAADAAVRWKAGDGGGAAAELGFDVQAALVQVEQRLHQGQAEAGAFVAPAERMLELTER